jgi:prevent-host-death family protein
MSESEITVAFAREHLAEYLSRVTYTKDRFVVTKHGKKIAAVIPYEDLKILEKLEEDIDIAQARKALAEVKKNGIVPWQKAKKKLGL